MVRSPGLALALYPGRALPTTVTAGLHRIFTKLGSQRPTLAYNAPARRKSIQSAVFAIPPPPRRKFLLAAANHPIDNRASGIRYKPVHLSSFSALTPGD